LKPSPIRPNWPKLFENRKARKNIYFLGSLGYDSGIAVKAETLCPILPKAKKACRKPNARRVRRGTPSRRRADEKYFAEFPS
jgi:hypothetical protein